VSTEPPQPDRDEPTTTADRRRRPGELTDTDRQAIRAAVAALPPLTDEQIDQLCAVILNARRQRDPDPLPDP